jgi:uncharacterized protein YjbI with pentapeptide repeats
MRYPPDQLVLLRERWNSPLLDPTGGEPVVVEECRTLGELLRKRLAALGLLSGTDVLACSGTGKTDSWRNELHDRWANEYETGFAGLMAELRDFGLPEITVIEPGRYEIREPYDLRGAGLQGIFLVGAYLENARFEGADLTGACLAGARCFETHFEDALCGQASFTGAECHFADFRGANCDHASFERADCTMVRFDQARLRHASFDSATCFAAVFDGAFLSHAQFDTMRINHLTRFGTPGEQTEAQRARPLSRDAKSEGDDWYIVELFPVWLRAADVNAQIRSLLKSHGYFWQADEYQYLEMVCRRHVLHQNRFSEFFEWFFKDLMFGYGLKWERPFITVLIIILLWALGFALHFRLNGLHGLFTSIGYGFYYSVISFTTLGFGNAPDLEGAWPKVLLCSEALLGTILMPLFLLAYARKILQD